MSPGHMLQQL